MNDDYEIVSVEEAGIDITVPAPDEGDPFEEALAEFDADDEEEEQEQARPNRRVLRAVKRAERRHGAGWTRPFRKGRESKP